MKPLPDARARSQVRSALDTTLIVDASAGTGKTTALVSRVVELVRSGTATISGIVAITFTERAAGELRLRIRQGLDRAVADEPEREVMARLEAARATIEEASLGTIHAFCSQLLHEHPVEAGVDPDFTILTDTERSAFFEPLFRDWLREQLERPGPGVARVLRRSRGREEPVDTLRGAARRLLDHRELPAAWDPPVGYDRDAAVRRLLYDDGADDGAGVCLTTLAEVVRALPPPAAGGRINWLYRTLADAAELEREIRVRKEAGRWDPDWVEQSLATLEIPDWGYARPLPAAVTTRLLAAHPQLPVKAGAVDLIQVRKDFRERLESFRRKSGADLAAQLREELRPLLARYEAAKRKAGKLDFDDLLLRTRDLLDRDPGLRELLRKRYTHFLLDEFQDTDPIQTEIAFQLTAPRAPEDGDWRKAVPAPGRLFLVGDPKQSIYRFRRAEVEHYRATKKHLLENGANEVVLTSNFRAAPALCDFVNAALKPLLDAPPDEKTGVEQVGYSPISATRPPTDATALGVIRVPEGEDSPAKNAAEITAMEPAAVARFVARLLESGFRVTRTDGTAGPVEPSDICLLFRRFRHGGNLVPQRYAEALQQRDLPHALGAIPSYTGSAEIGALRAALTAVEFPDDELSVYAALRGPLFSFPDEELFLFRERRGLRLRPGTTGPLPEDAPATDRGVAEALSFLDDLHRQRNRRPLADTLRALLERHRAETAFAFWKSPDQVLANLRLLTQSARQFEAGGGLSFRGFVRRLEAEANDPDFGARSAHDPEVRGVRMLTVHSAKGLEFPVVILVDTPCRRAGRADRVVRPEEGLYACDLRRGLRPRALLDAEEVEKAADLCEQDRLLYVAATRARDLLAVVAPSAQYDLDRSWLRALYDRLSGAFGEPPPLLEFDSNAGAAGPDAGARRWNLLSGGATTEDDPTERFREERARTLARGSVPTRRVAAAGRYAGREFDPAPVAVHELPRPANRPGGARFGELVHRILERAPFLPAAAGDPGPAPVPELAETAAAELGIESGLVAPAVAAVEAALGHEVLRAARRAAARGACYRECPVFLREDHPAPEEAPSAPAETAPGADEARSDPAADETEAGGPILVEGQVDLLYQTEVDGPWTVVDFKTGLTDDDEERAEEREAALARYRRQVTLYARAVTRATGRPAEPVLLFL